MKLIIGGTHRAEKSILSSEKIGDVLGINMHTLEEYLGFLEDVYPMYPVAHFFYSLKQQITNPRKIYGADNSMINAVSFRFSEDLGKQLENLAFLEIRRRDCECYYWKGKKEGDFLIKEREKVAQAIQVSWSLKDAALLKREVAGLMEALTMFDLPGGIILTYDEFDRFDSGGRRIDVLPSGSGCWRPGYGLFAISHFGRQTIILTAPSCAREPIRIVAGTVIKSAGGSGNGVFSGGRGSTGEGNWLTNWGRRCECTGSFKNSGSNSTIRH